MTTVDFSVLEPENAVDASQEEYIHAAMVWHFSEDTGSRYWLEKKGQLGFDPIRDVRSYDDLRRFPDLVEELRFAALDDIVPRGYGRPYPAPEIWETGGSTGPAKRAVIMPELARYMHKLGVDYFFRAPVGTTTLSMIPHGPHGGGAQYSVASQGNRTLLTIDFDPRWAKKLVGRGDTEELAAYTDHLIEQARVILVNQNIGGILCSPALLERLAKDPEMLGHIRQKTRHIGWGGSSLAPGRREVLEAEFGPGIEFSSFYGSSVALPQGFSRDGEFHEGEVIYDKHDPFSIWRVVDPETLEPVEYEERGQVLMHHVSKSQLIPNNLERDTAIRLPGPVGAPGDSVSSPQPVGEIKGQKVVEGLF